MTVTPRPRRHLQHHDLRPPPEPDASGTSTDAHALAVSATVRLLQHHLNRLRFGQATPDERHVITTIVTAAATARTCLRDYAY